MGTKSNLIFRCCVYAIVAMAVFSFTVVGTELDASFAYLEGQASWYAEFSPGIKATTANMEKFDHDELTCATWGLPFNTLLEVTNVRNGKKVIVRVNDRGPSRRLFREGRVVDLTMGAFRRIEDLTRGLADVRVKVIRPAR